MFKRKIMQDLIKWKNEDHTKALIIKGPKGIGKSTIIEKFAKENYRCFVKLDFEQNSRFSKIFSGDLDMSTLIKKMTLFLQTENIQANHTLFFFDEVHLCPNARIAAKTLIASGKYDCIMATSYFFINTELFPIQALPHEQIMDMNSMDFEEYLWANGITDQTIEDLKTYFLSQTVVPTSLHETLIDLFKEYILVGGMPFVVTTFFKTHNFKTVSKQQQKIMNSYIDDMKLYLSKPDYVKAEKTFKSIPLQLEKENKKFQYGTIEYRSTARKYENSILWLYYVDMVNISFNTAQPKLPFASQAKPDIFKVYYKDIGLLSGQYGADIQQEFMLGDHTIKEGALLEASIADVLMKNGKKLYYYATNTTLEVDFLIKIGNQAMPIEVKNADNTKSKTFKTLFENYGFNTGIKFGFSNIENQAGVTKYPIYFAMFI